MQHFDDNESTKRPNSESHISQFRYKNLMYLRNAIEEILWDSKKMMSYLQYLLSTQIRMTNFEIMSRSFGYYIKKDKTTSRFSNADHLNTTINQQTNIS